MRLSKILVLSLSMMTGFFALAQTGNTVTDSFQVAGVYRKYRLYVPNVYSTVKAAPLILNLHGLTSNATQQQFYGNFMGISDTAGFLVVHPEGSLSGTVQYWNVGVFPAPDDVLFLDRLIDTLNVKYNVDDNALYMCGMSNGGIMSYYFACQRPGKLAAIASVAGTMFRPWFYSCSSTLALPVMEIHGTQDATIPYAGNSVPGTAGTYLGVDSVIDKWVRLNGCETTPQTFSVADVFAADASTATNYKYLNGTDGSSVELYKVEGGSHSWPGALNIFAGTNQDFSASAEIWRFFRQYKRSQFTEPLGLFEKMEWLSSIKIAPNPCAESFKLITDSTVNFRLFEISGRLLMSGESNQTILVSHLLPGIYLLEITDGYNSGVTKLIKRE